MTPSPAQRWLRRTTARGARRLLTVLGEPVLPPGMPLPPPPAPPSPPRRAVELPGELGVERGSVTEVLAARLTPEDHAATQRYMDADPAVIELMASVSERERRSLSVIYAMHFGVESAIEHLGLSTVQPPEQVHAMGRGPLAAAGGLYEADLVVDALASAGVEIGAIRSGLDFGCSSGRVVRVLASAYPDVAWHGCDPNEEAIAWARQELEGIRFFRSPDRPPLDLPGGSLDLVYAISIWSHFEPALGLAWLDEMHRLLRPGAHLVMTTHGTTTIEHDARNGLRTPEQLAEIAEALQTHGTWYAAEFGEAGDWGVVNPDWGTAFLTAEWLMSHLCPRWQIVEFAPGRNARNQDVYVLRRA